MGNFLKRILIQRGQVQTDKGVFGRNESNMNIREQQKKYVAQNIRDPDGFWFNYDQNWWMNPSAIGSGTYWRR